MNDESFKQELIKIFQSFCVGLETITPNDYVSETSFTSVNKETGKKIKTTYLRKK